MLGLVFAVVWARDRLVVTVSPTRVTLVRGDKTRRIEADLDAVYLDGKELVLRTTDGREIAREKTDLAGRELAPAFAEKGFERTTTADICRAAGISSGSLFHYFWSSGPPTPVRSTPASPRAAAGWVAGLLDAIISRAGLDPDLDLAAEQAILRTILIRFLRPVSPPAGG